MYSIYPTLLDSFHWLQKMGTEEKFNELIDKINRVKKDMPIAALRGVEFEECVNNMLKNIPNKVNEHGFIVTKNFEFNGGVVRKIADKLRNAKKLQEYVEGVVGTSKGDVKVYGFIDYSYPNMFVDLKTTSRYSYGKYEVNNQHKCYPLLANLKGREIQRFTYFVTDFNNTYLEPYDYSNNLRDEFIYNLECFIDFIEEYRHLITDTKIFGK